MKKINRILSIAALGAFALIFNACTDEVEREPSPVQTEGIMAYIAYETPTSLSFLPDDKQAFPVTIGRQVATEAATVQLVVEGEKFKVPQAVEFAAGESEKTIEVSFDIDLGTSASVKIAIGENQTYLYGLTEQTITVNRDYTWIPAGKVNFNDPNFGVVETLDVQKAKESKDGLHRIVEPYCETGVGIHLQFTLDANNNAVSLLPVDTFYELGTGYQMYYSPTSYGDYCFFRNEGKEFTFGFVMTNDGSSLYVGGGSFTWVEGYPGDSQEEK